MQTEALRVFFEATRLRSIRKAGDKLGLAPSSVSRHIKTLERQFGTALIDRSAKGVAVTDAGERVVTFARQVLNDYASLRMDLNDYQGGYKALIRVALVEGISAAGPSLAMTRFRQRFRDVRFEITMMSAPQVNEAVRRADADLGISFGADTHPEFSAVSLTAEPLIYAARRDTPAGALAMAHASVDLKQLSAQTLFPSLWHHRRKRSQCLSKHLLPAPASRPISNTRRSRPGKRMSYVAERWKGFVMRKICYDCNASCA